jgi:hypothetical protein
VLDVDPNPLIDADLDVRERDGLESGHFGGNRVVPGRQSRRGVLAVGVRGHDPRQSGSLIEDGDLGVGDHRTGGIGDGAEDGSGDGLRQGHTGRQTEHEKRGAHQAYRGRTDVPDHLPPPLTGMHPERSSNQ